jgi:pimeloyl-ACP methyl ester carboxylesterase
MIIEVLGEAIQKFVVEQPVIVAGHSTGGFVAVGVAGRYPDMIAGVISISGFFRGRWNGALGLLQRIASLGPLGPWLFRTSTSLLVAHRSIYRLAVGLYAKDRKALYSHPTFKDRFDVFYTDAKRQQADLLFPILNECRTLT